MDEIGEDGLLRHEVPTGRVLRVILVVGGLFAIMIATLELHRGVWPFNLFSPFFLAILLGAFAVGVPMTMAGLFGPALRWIVGPQRIDIEMTNPFGKKTVSITPDTIAGFALREHDWDSRANSWSVVVTTLDGKRYETRDLSSEAAAGQFRERIQSLFYGPPRMSTTIDEIGHDGLLRHRAPTGIVMRGFLIASGVFIMIVSAQELFRSGWPPSLLGLPFTLILVAVFAVGIPMALVGLLGPSLDWTVGRGRIDIDSRNPFGVRHFSFTPRDISSLALHEYEGDGGPSSWSVLLVTRTGKRYQTRSYGSRDAAERLKDRIEALFYA